MPKLKEVAPCVRIGAPIERQNLSIFPLFAEDVVQTPHYATVGNALRNGAAKITEVSEGGSVPTLALENFTEIPILIIDGEELLGARQNRISNLTVLAPGKKTLPLPVSCVERGRWSYQSREFAESPDIMYRGARAKKARAVSRNLVMADSRMSDQGEVWSDIDALSSRLGFDSPTSAMQDVYQSRRTTIEEYLSGVTVAEGQVGAIFAINGTPAGVEMFDSPETLRTYMPKILRSYAMDALANYTLTSAKASDAEAERLLDSILELDAKSFPAIGLGEDLRIDSPSIAGGALAENGRVIHLAAFQTTLPDPHTNPSEDSDNTRPMVVRNGHMMIRGGQGRLALLDTGSPVSVGRGAAYTVAGRSWNPATAMQPVLDAAGQHIGRRLDWLFGHDFFAANPVLIDWPGRRVHILSPNAGPLRGRTIPLELVMGVPVVTGRSALGPVRAVIGSSAALSYVPSNVVEGLAPAGKHRDFFPGFGEFETDMWRVRTEIGGRSLILSAGILPPMLQMMLALVLGADGWIIGSDFFRDRVTIIDYPSERLIV